MPTNNALITLNKLYRKCVVISSDVADDGALATEHGILHSVIIVVSTVPHLLFVAPTIIQIPAMERCTVVHWARRSRNLYILHEQMQNAHQ